MKLFSESYKLVSGEAARSAALMLQFFLFTVVMCFALGNLECSFKLESRIRNAGLCDAVYFFPNQTYASTYVLEKNALPEGLTPIGEKVVAVNEDVDSLVVYDNSYWKRLEYNLSKGRRLGENAVNEAVISRDLASRYRVGDTAEFTYNDQRVTLKIVGILAENEQMLFLNSGGSGVDLENIFEVPYRTVFTSKIIDSDGNEPAFRPRPSGFLFDTHGYTCEELNTEYKSIGYFMSVSDIVINTRINRAGIIETYLMFAAVILIISVLGISINNLYTLRLNEKSFAVYYMSGLSLTGFSRILIMRAFIICAFPVTGALCLAAYVVKAQMLPDIEFGLKYWILSYAFAAVISFITCLPLYKKLKHTEPMEFLKRGV